jgi:Domain of unknown function (DUF222)
LAVVGRDAIGPVRGSFVPQRFSGAFVTLWAPEIVVHVCHSARVDGTVERAAAEIASFMSTRVYGLSDPALRESAVDLQRIVSLATAALSTVIREAHGRDLPGRDGAASTVAWLRELLRVTAAEARSLNAVGEILDARVSLVDAVCAGVVNVGQVLAIGQVLRDVPADEPALVDKVEGVLVEHAQQFEPMILRRLGERVLAHVNPGLAEDRLRDRLERDERRAHQRRGFTMSPDGLGGMRVSGVVDSEGAAIIGAAIEPLTAPRRDATGPDVRTPAARRADALVDVCRLALRSNELPDSGGQLAQVVVTIDHAALRRDIAVGHLDTGQVLSPAATRRLACDAGILPVVLNGSGVPIDIGRGRRPYTGAARMAVLLRDRGRAFPGCDRPPRWCDVHRVVFWSHGGSTDRDNGVTLCGYHHRVIHAEFWRVRIGSGGRPEFIPPRHVDPDQRPLRNVYHDRE